MRLSGQFQIFYKKNFEHTKKSIKSSKKQLTKQKQGKTKNNKGNNFSRTKTSKRVKIACFAFWYFFYAQYFFVKK